jgi:hypothetical protein
MRTRLFIFFTVGFAALAISVLSAVLLTLAASEIEPNNDAAHATFLDEFTPMTGAISPTSDVDWFGLSGINPTWGYIALLDTISSTGSTTATLTALGNDGSTELQVDTASWERGSGIALQSYVDSGLTHYLKIKAAIGGTTIDTYTLRMYNTIVTTRTEVEPNNTRSTGTPSGFTMAGVISPTSDVDCFSFQGRINDTIVIALDGDPENNGSPINPRLRLIGPTDTVLKTANVSGMGGKEFIRYTNLPSNGVYAYCVSAAAGTGGPTATYNVGIVREGNGLYMPDYANNAIWLNRPILTHTQIGDVLAFKIILTNTSPLTIPNGVNMYADFNAECLTPISSVPLTTSGGSGSLGWYGVNTSLSPGQVFSVTFDMRAKALCNDQVYGDYSLPYYITGGGTDVDYVIYTNVYLPIVLRSS